MGSSRKYYTPPPPNPNAQGIGTSKSTYNIPVVSPYENQQSYTPFFMQQAVNPTEGNPQSFFNKYGSVGEPIAQTPYNSNANANINASSLRGFFPSGGTGVWF